MLRCSGTDWFFNEANPNVHEVAMYQAYFATIKCINNNLSLVVNPKTKFMQRPSVLDEVYEGTIQAEDLIGCRVHTIYNLSQSFRVVGVDEKMSPLSKFNRQGTTVSFQSYLRDRYGLELKYADYPLMLKCEVRRKQFVYLVPE